MAMASGEVLEAEAGVWLGFRREKREKSERRIERAIRGLKYFALGLWGWGMGV